MALTFGTRVLKVEVKEKKVKHEETREMPAFFETIKIGKLTLEFDGDNVDVNAVAAMIGDAPVMLGLANTNFQLPPEFQQA